jgi:hypothetical protein
MDIDCELKRLETAYRQDGSIIAMRRSLNPADGFDVFVFRRALGSNLAQHRRVPDWAVERLRHCAIACS